MYYLKLSRCRGQCYDDGSNIAGSNMAGSRNGVKSQILKQEPRALLMYCYGHALSLSIADSARLIRLLGSTMATTHKISRCCSIPPGIFKCVKAQIFPGSARFRLLCPTQWTARSETTSSIIDNNDASGILGVSPRQSTRLRQEHV